MAQAQQGDSGNTNYNYFIYGGVVAVIVIGGYLVYKYFITNNLLNV